MTEPLPEKNPNKVRAGRLGGLAGKGKRSPHSRENGRLGGRPRKADASPRSIARRAARTHALRAEQLDPPRRLVGWTVGDGSGHHGDTVEAWFDASGRYLGPDRHGIEPIFDDLEDRIARRAGHHT